MNNVVRNKNIAINNKLDEIVKEIVIRFFIFNEFFGSQKDEHTL